MRNKLPNKWVVERNNGNSNEILSFFNKGCGKKYIIGTYFHFPNFRDMKGFSYGNHTSGHIISGYEEITFEEFKILVLKEKPLEPNYEIY